MIFMRKLHDWLGILIGLQMLVWLLSGTVISLLDSDTVSGEIYQAPVEPQRLATAAMYIQPLATMIGAEEFISFELVSILEQPFYRVATASEHYLVHPDSGERVAITAEAAQRLALNDYTGPGNLVTLDLLPGPTLETRDYPDTVWRVGFDDALNTRLYVSADTGSILERRNDRWALFDFFLMLHFMDYAREDNFNNLPVIALGFGSLWLSVTGFLLLFTSFNVFPRRQARLVPAASQDAAS